MRWDISRESAQLGEDDSENLHPDCFLSVPDMIRIELDIVFGAFCSQPLFSNSYIFIELLNESANRLVYGPVTGSLEGLISPIILASKIWTKSSFLSFSVSLKFLSPK